MQNELGLMIFIAVTEIMTYKTRLLAAFYMNIVGSISHVVLPWTAYWLRDWRFVSLFNSLIVCPYFVIYFFLPRSPR